MTSFVSASKYDRVLQLLNSKGYKERKLTYEKIAKKAGVSPSFVRNVKVGTTRRADDAGDIKAASRSVDALRRAKEETKRVRLELTAALKELKMLSLLRDVKANIVPTSFKLRRRSRKEVVAFLLLSDWHIGETVDANEVQGLNKFDLRIAETRLSELFEAYLSIVNMLRSNSTIKTLVIGALGDFISGWIHPDFVEDDEMTPPEACLKFFDLMIGGLDFLLKHGEFDKIIFIGCCGNHGRITDYTRTKRRSKKNYEWLVYELLARAYAEKEEKRLLFQIPSGYFGWLDVFGRRIRFHHGDNIKYFGGVGGLHIPLRKAIAQWDKAKHADLDVLGHWHTRETSSKYVVNGSVIGYSQYSERIKADFEPPQQSSFIIHPKFGKTGEFPIVVG